MTEREGEGGIITIQMFWWGLANKRLQTTDVEDICYPKYGIQCMILGYQCVVRAILSR